MDFSAIDFTKNENIAYAMRNTEAREHFFNFNAPSQLLDWSHLAIEWIMILGAVLALVHAIRTARQTRSPSALYTFSAIFLYGLVPFFTGNRSGECRVLQRHPLHDF